LDERKGPEDTVRLKERTSLLFFFFPASKKAQEPEKLPSLGALLKRFIRCF
jgi:hypothetical protein